MDDKIVKILFVETDSGDLYYVRELLSEYDATGFQVESVTRLQSAVDYLQDHVCDVVLLDLNLPDSIGLDTFTTFHKQFPKIPIVVLTGNDDDKLGLEAVQSGAQDYIVKNGMDVHLLIKSIRYAVERHRLLEELRRAKSHEQHRAYHDMLTGLPNRLLFHDRLHQAVSQAKRTGNQLGLLFLDLDGFKLINDSLGHDVGDLLLQAVAKRLQLVVREGDTVARIGGDEFVILLINIYNDEDAAKVARKIITVMADPFVINEHELAASVSIGISLYPNDSDDIDALLKNADKAMYRAKNKGENNFHFFLPAKDPDMVKRLKLENDLRVAIEHDELALHYQPQVDLKTRKITGVEALVRWQHPDFGMLPPSQFIPLAEETGLIVPLGEWVLWRGCQQCKQWQRVGIPTVRMSVNLSTRQFMVMRLKETVKQSIDRARISPNQLVLEITETGAMQNIEHTVKTLKGLRELGTRIAMDDFGTGYASLNYLKRFPLDILKIDHSFVNGLHTNHGDWAIVSAVVAMARRLNLKVLAEGVEQEEQLMYLRALKCDEFQGFLISKAVPAHEISAMLTSRPDMVGVNDAVSSGSFWKNCVKTLKNLA